MTEVEILALINLHIVANGNNEITANILRPILQEMLSQPNDKIGELTNLDTTDKSNIVNAINELYNSLSGFNIHTGTDDPNITLPSSFSIGDWYIRSGSSLYQYNGDVWVLLSSSSSSLEVRIDGLLVDILGKTTLTAWEVNDTFRGWVDSKTRYVVGKIISVTGLTMPDDIDDNTKVLLAVNNNL